MSAALDVVVSDKKHTFNHKCRPHFSVGEDTEGGCTFTDWVTGPCSVTCGGGKRVKSRQLQTIQGTGVDIVHCNG